MKKIHATKVKTIDQKSFARTIANELGFNISDVEAIIDAEQRMTMEYVKMGYRVIKKNYITIEAKSAPAKKDWKCPINGKVYNVPAKTRICLKAGLAFKQFINNKKMPPKMCRFVENSSTQKVPEAV